MEIENKEGFVYAHKHTLLPTVINEGNIMINHYKLEFNFPVIKKTYRDELPFVSHGTLSDNSIRIIQNDKEQMYQITYISKGVLFPKDTHVLLRDVSFIYRINEAFWRVLQNRPPIQWIIYADNMPPKQGDCPVPHNFS